MIVTRFVQTSSAFSASYTLNGENGVLYSAKVPFNFAGYRADLLKDGDMCFSISWNTETNLKNVPKRGTEKELAYYEVTDEGGSVRGRICRKRSKRFNAYFYYELELDGNVYQLYEVGMGKQGIKLPVYCGEKQFALAEKDMEIINNNDSYTLSCLSEGGIIPSVLLLLYYDYLRFGHHGEVSDKSRKTFTMYSTNKELKRKYDPDWASR